MKYYIIVGEPSGDLHASNLMRGLQTVDTEADFRFWGGDLMAAVGGQMVRHYRDTAVMGVVDVIFSLPKIQRNFKLCKHDMLEYQPDVVILVDYAGFNLPMAKFAKQHRFRTHYYIAPKTWASKEHRVRQIRKYVDKLYTIMPFETEYFARHRIEASYCGNPVMDAIENRPFKGEAFEDFCRRNSLSDKPKVALLAGSRRSELKYNLPVMLSAVKHFPDYEFVIAGAPSFAVADYEPYLAGNENVKLVFDQTYQLVQQARLALVTSGTATLETALLRCPQVVVYLMWGGAFSNFVAHRLIKVPFISLVNLILGREAVVELFQSAYTQPRMLALMRELISDSESRTRMLADYEELAARVGNHGCSHRAAQMMYNDLKTK